MGIKAVWGFALAPLDLTQRNGWLDSSDNGFGATILKIKDVGKLAVVSLRPDVAARSGINQLYPRQSLPRMLVEVSQKHPLVRHGAGCQGDEGLPR